MVMGHELSHGFDDSGRRFDPRGRLADVVVSRGGTRATKSARPAFPTSTRPTSRSPGSVSTDGLPSGRTSPISGECASPHAAYRLWREAEGGESPEVPDLTPDQLFFVGFAQTWCALQTPEVERLRVATDPHSPPRFRVNGPLSNFEGFAEAFSCPVGSPMRPERTCRVW
jgi:Predicted metalloendopeptidase